MNGLHRGLDIPALVSPSLASSQHFGAFFAAALYVLNDFIELVFIDLWALFCAVVKGVAKDSVFAQIGAFVHKLVVNGFVDIDLSGRATGRTGAHKHTQVLKMS
jgi:hypothetical protein